MPMKASKIIILIAIFFTGLQLSAQETSLQKKTFKVWGNCDMCKSTIEKAAKSVDGVSSAKWNVSSKKMMVKFDSDRTSLEDIQNAIVSSGYDLETQKSSEEAYNNLHKCCQYDRE